MRRIHPEPDITVWDLSTLPWPEKVASISDSTATAHNCYVRDGYLFVSYYTAGFRVYDVSDPTRPVLFDEYDTSPLVGEGIYEGAWGVYPFLPSGHVLVSDRPSGLFIFSFDATPSAVHHVSPLRTGLEKTIEYFDQLLRE